MEIEEVREKIIQNGGFITLKAIRQAFSEDNSEVLDMKIAFLVKKNRIRKIEYQSPDGPGTIYYIPTA